MAEPLKLECSVEFEDEWRQLECHWDYKRFFTIKCKIFHGAVYTATGTKVSEGESLGFANGLPKIEFYIAEGSNAFRATTMTTYKKGPKLEAYTSTAGIYRNATSYECRIPFENLDLKTLCEANGCFNAKVKAFSDAGTAYEKTCSINTAAAKLPYYLEFAPTMSGVVEVKKETSYRTKCSWTKAEPAADYSPIYGYCVELRYRAGESGPFSTVKGLTAVKEESSYWLKKSAPAATASIEALEDEPPIESYEIAGKDIEVPILGADTTEIYFNPSDLGIERDYQIKVAVYPFTVYGLPVDYEPTEDEILNSSLLAGPGISSEALNKQLGLVRIKTSNGWVEGQVWVKTSNGWKESCGVYTKTSTGWKESI